jgi:hypothetical protein
LFENELKERLIRVSLLSLIVKVDRSDYSIKYENQQVHIVQLEYKGSGHGPDGWVGSVGLLPTAFIAQDGQIIYNLIQIAIKNGGRLQLIQQGKY